MPHLRRLLGLGFLLVAYAPLHRLLDPRRTGLAGATTRRVAEQLWASGLWGTLLVGAVAAALAILLPGDPTAVWSRLRRWLVALPASVFAAGCALLATALSATASWVLFGRLPTSVDAMVQLLHAQVLTTGSPALPLPADAAAWLVQNSVLTPHGWASVYPPFHTFALAAGLAAGAAWLVGPISAGLTAGTTALGMARLLPQRPGAARATALLTALSPMGILLGGSYLSHTLAGALVAGTLWILLRARDGRGAWSLAAGAAIGALVATRPWTGLVLASALVLATWIPGGGTRGPRWWAGRGAGLVAGGTPFAVLLLAWNHRLFGHPLRLGYTAAFGPSHGLGFHPDPWGNVYGPREALAYTGADLVQLGANLLETPVPAVALVGVAFVLVRGVWRPALPLLAWALAGVAANAVYWHHGIHMGPRMLYETLPAWIGLFVLAAAALGSPGAPLGHRTRKAMAWTVVLSLAGAVVLAPGRLGAYRGGASAQLRIRPPEDVPTLAFAHGSWTSRVAARLVAAGMRRDSVETALRRNDLCSVDAYSRWLSGGAPGASPPLSFESLPGPAPGLQGRTLSPGNAVLVRPGVPPPPACLREARADRLGSVELEPLEWQAPPLPGARFVVARDLGPEENAGVLERFPGATAWVVLEGATPGTFRFVPYDEGMALLWEAPSPGINQGGA